ncbi:MAG: hypothetical protein F6K50_33770 [Moorea sp. SIO3I7]|uniref:hypothetical protein n=1 Tax=unclassified Moorena TaxID=2683338 RepID=UPI0013C0D91D|nr:MULTISPECIES: hypothetical protein [unclassified Moorena]NEO00249.1 hypothetical protein [Moorena sp. SIO3I7]NEO05284.1 hypothetical protein [Moorena sp. SIO3I8]NEO19188.1 hypothetical protein [Moorena sp. SIO4A5]NEP21542.1 hypothetical protein [Moorena sp. SIO3I6]NEQ57826.1 hypothetical protein [Moorena sp. SIO4A1]
MGRWGDGEKREKREIFIKGNYPDKILGRENQVNCVRLIRKKNRSNRFCTSQPQLTEQSLLNTPRFWNL